MFRLVGLVIVAALTAGSWKAGTDVMTSFANAIGSIMQRNDIVQIQKHIVAFYRETGRLPAAEVTPSGPLYTFVRSKMGAAGRDPGLDHWGNPYWFTSGTFYRHNLDAAAGQFAVGSAGPDRVAFTRDDIYVIAGP